MVDDHMWVSLAVRFAIVYSQDRFKLSAMRFPRAGRLNQPTLSIKYVYYKLESYIVPVTQTCKSFRFEW